MKCKLFITVFLVMCLFLQARGNCFFAGKDYTEGEHILECTRLICNKDGTISMIACPLFACQEQVGFQERDLSKPYPECCERPICKEE